MRFDTVADRVDSVVRCLPRFWDGYDTIDLYIYIYTYIYIYIHVYTVVSTRYPIGRSKI